MAFSDNPRRDAHRSFAGYVYQVDVSILNWLRLCDNQRLELESGEDIDQIQDAADASAEEQERLLQQLKDLSDPITLRSEDSREALANFCHHRAVHPNHDLRFRFLTTATVGKEKAPWGEPKPGIELWEEIRTDQIAPESRTQKLDTLRGFIKGLTKPAGLSEAVWDALQQVLNGSLTEFETVVNRFEWATGSGDHDAVEAMIFEELIASSQVRTDLRARGIYQNLFTYVIKLLTRHGLKELTVASLQCQIASSSVTAADHAAAKRLRNWTDKIDAALVDQDQRIKALETAVERAQDDTFFTPSDIPADPNRLFDFNQVLQGRSEAIGLLDGFLGNDAKSVALLPGRGGVGKSKLLREWTVDLNRLDCHVDQSLRHLEP